MLRLGSRFTAILLVMRVDPGHALAAQHPLEGTRDAAAATVGFSLRRPCTLWSLRSLVEIGGARGAAFAFAFAFRCSPCSLCTLILCSLVLCSLVEIA